MIKESGKAVKRGSERVLGRLEFLGGSAVRLLDLMLIPRGGARAPVPLDSVVLPPVPESVSIGSMVINVGPVPDELRKDPFPGGSVPWSIIEAEKEHVWVRKMAIWKVAVGVSWVVTTVAALRALGIL